MSRTRRSTNCKRGRNPSWIADSIHCSVVSGGSDDIDAESPDLADTILQPVKFDLASGSCAQ
jgi:hypothetical protein